MRLKVISCEVLTREMQAAAARSHNQIDLEFLPMSLHDEERSVLRGKIQNIIDGADASRHDSVVLGYGLCGNSVAGLQAREIPLVVPRAHDCISIFFGERSSLLVDPNEERLQREFEGVKRTYVPMHAVLRIDEVLKPGPSRITDAGPEGRVAPFPVPVPRPEKG